MTKYLIPEKGKFYKAALHCHSTVSDGKLTPEDLKREYMNLGYSVVAYTDHDIMIPHPELLDENFVPIAGMEIAIDKTENWKNYQNTYHLNIYAPEVNRSVSATFCEANASKREHTKAMITDEMRAVAQEKREYTKEFAQKMIDIATEEGCLVSFNHPVWSLNTRDDYSGLKGFFGVEWMNTGCDMSGYIDTMQPIAELLSEGERMCYPLATDDIHTMKQLGKSWCQIKAEKLDYDTIFEALRKGDFYSSNGPEIHELYVKDDVVYIKTSNACRISLVTDHRLIISKRSDNDDLTEAELSLATLKEHMENAPEGHVTWLRVDVMDKNGKYARTRAFFPEELFD